MVKNIKRMLLNAVFVALSATAAAQQIDVGGTVKDNNGETIIGATVMEEGTKNATVTDFDGNFRLKTPQGAKLKISYIGYKTVTVTAAPHLDIVLEEDNAELDELVVTGYTTQRKADLTGSVAVVSTKDLMTSPDPDPMRALQGRVPGMTVTGNGSPIGTGTVRIRGVGSINSSQDPLFIIDGVPTTASLNSLNTNDIESMQVLKDAA